MSIIIFLYFVKAAFAQVPGEWQTAFNQLQPKLQSINAKILSKWDGQKYATTFSNDLLLANSNSGYDMIDSATQASRLIAIDSVLAAYKFVGLKGVAIALNFPMLVNTFPNAEKYRQYYLQVVQKARSKGFKIVIGVQATFVDTVFGEPRLVSDVLQFYSGLNNTRFKHEKTQMLQTIIDDLGPDYLVLEVEPKTQEVNLGYRVDYAADSVVVYVNYFLSHLNKKSTQLGAGAGTWDDLSYFTKLAAQTGIDFIAYHIYPPHFNYFDDMAFKVDSLASVYNKKLVIDEAWCYKASNAEIMSVTAPVATSAEFFSRDMFSYWSPLDTLFIRTMINLANQSKVEFISFFWPTVMFDYLNYNPATHANMPPGKKLRAGQQAGFQKMLGKQLSPTGAFLQKQLALATAVEEKELESMPSAFSLAQNYPNPFNPDTEIKYSLSKSGYTKLDVYDVLGRFVKSLVNSYQNAGSYHIQFIAKELPSGIYFYRLLSDTYSETKKMLLVK